MVTFILLVIGGLNWGLEIFDLGLERWVGEGSVVAQVVYALVALSAIFELATHKKNCKACGSKGGGMQGGAPAGNPNAGGM